MAPHVAAIIVGTWLSFPLNLILFSYPTSSHSNAGAHYNPSFPSRESLCSTKPMYSTISQTNKDSKKIIREIIKGIINIKLVEVHQLIILIIIKLT